MKAYLEAKQLLYEQKKQKVMVIILDCLLTDLAAPSDVFNVANDNPH
ncbi:hypothetical protein XNC3_1140001 [Xenorhabdus nematophila F1]|nr:hypothetical protein XNC3_1140001 [Xenorhabdus nematophila F1]